MGQSGGKMPGNLQLAKGEPRPKGCCESPKGGEVNFTIDAPGRGSVWLYLLLPEGHEGASTLEGVDSSGGELYVQLDPSTNKTGDTWHVKLTLPGGFDPKGAKYMWILDPKLDQHGLPEANAVRILDPCAKCLDSRYAKDWNKRGGPKFSPMAVVPDRRAIYEFDWQGVKPPNLHLKDLVIYEAHVRGFTRNPDSKLQDWDATAGTFLGFIQKIPHLLKLGINAVELLPVYEFDETACPRKNPENGEQLCNFWGYSTVNFFVPMQRFSSRDRIGAAIVGFKTLVRELHRQGIEVILDVVFNHTAEGAWGEHFWHSWAAIAKNRYYILSNGQDTNYTGCGNTVNANDPMCSDWIVECLSYWVDEMHVDGFRFDLASALTRGNDGKVSMDPLLIKKMANVNFIIESETKWGHMTLMHRYNNCRDMIQTWSSRSNTGEAAMRRMPSWSATFNKDALRRASWSRLPSASLLIDPEEEKSEEQDDELWSWIFVWQRFSFMRLLDWQRNYNTKPRELAGATDSLANKICSVWKEYPNIRLWARWTLATIGRGGNQGQAIRDEILHIMHRNKIPETKGHFYEEWHQKLHNNTTPDDVGICKALLAFLRTGGKMEEYWKVLHDHGITKERLASYERSITKEPYMHGDAGRLIMEFENYLRILQSVHDALDLKTAIDAAKSCLPKQVMDQLQEISGSDAKMKRSRSLGSLDKDSQEKSHQRFMKLAEARLGILGILNDSKTDVGVIRQLLLLDYSLETQQSVIAQGNTDETRLPTLCEQMKAFLTSVVGHIPLHGELRALLVDWTQLAPECANLKFGAGPAESALMLKALCDRLARVVGEQVDTFQTLLAPKATTLGQAVGVEKNVLEVFVDEVLRGSALFALSLILKRLEPQLRSIAQLPPWQMISAVDHPVQGELVSVPRMLHMQDKIFETPTIMLSGLVSGEEEVPVGVQAVLVRDAKSAPDILSHCAVRARNSGVLLASCYDSTLTEKIEAELLGQWVQVVCSADGSVEIKAAERPMADPKRMRMMARSASRDLTQELMSKETDSTKLVNMNLKEDFGCKWVVTPEKMDKSKVGSKSLNLALLKPQLPKDILTPQAVAMPYGSMQKALTSRENAKEWLSKLEACLAQLQPTSSNEDAKTIFQEAQVYVNALQMPSELDQALRSAMEEVGSKEGEKRLLNLYHRGDAWDATKQVWASLFGLRPWVSLAKAGRSFYDLNMAVLVQELLPAKYAFVLHTKNPFTNDPNEVYGEVVPGRGETLVGNYPGRALSFRARKGETPVVTSFLSKSTLLRTQECLIFRSDSNGEDLEGFAGAGLFESICATSDIPCMVRFHRLRLLTDHSFRQTLLSKLAEAGRAVEKAFGSPQDIEGCVDPQDRIFIVQSRPQV
ncbi:unnamed protein product [Effrenium voratum]|uniref:Glycosyl hydrolase family 13 catalytic domain-containing protein n=1 Tax=Effrenium voratum TaxID=2562239 RepID=A0AA36JR17_9DINO|nr:unnamed protein product [Effrenium voratum]